MHVYFLASMNISVWAKTSQPHPPPTPKRSCFNWFTPKCSVFWHTKISWLPLKKSVFIQACIFSSSFVFVFKIGCICKAVKALANKGEPGASVFVFVFLFLSFFKHLYSICFVFARSWKRWPIKGSPGAIVISTSYFYLNCSLYLFSFLYMYFSLCFSICIHYESICKAVKVRGQ